MDCFSVPAIALSFSIKSFLSCFSAQLPTSTGRSSSGWWHTCSSLCCIPLDRPQHTRVEPSLRTSRLSPSRHRPSFLQTLRGKIINMHFYHYYDEKKHFYLAGPCRDIFLSPIWSRRWYPNKSGSFRIFSGPLPLPYSVDRHWQVLGCHRIAAFAALLFHMSDCMMTRGTILTSVRSQHLRCLYV